MAKCPDCATPGAYIGLNSIECRNPACKHFKVDMKKTCGCCGVVGHEDDVCPDKKGPGPGDGPVPNGFRRGELNVYCWRKNER